jgi:glutamate synthase domain-containing protein 2
VKKPLRLKIPIFVSDMSFGALSEEAKVALARGAELAGTGIASGEGGMLLEEQAENSRYFYELASGWFGFSWDKLDLVQAFHFKGGQGAKTGTGGHLPGEKVQGKIAEVRGLPEGEPAVSPARFPEWTSLDDFRDFAAEVRERTGGIPIGFKLSAQHIEKDIDAALEIGVDYIILDGRGGGTGGLRTAADFAKAMALGADGVAVSNSAMQAIGCIAMRACQTNNCPVGIATQKPDLRSRLVVDEGAKRLARFLEATVHLMQTLARACGHTNLQDFVIDDLTTWKKEIAELTGVRFAGSGE